MNWLKSINDVKDWRGQTLIETKTYGPWDELIEDTGLKKTVIAERLGVEYSTFYKWRVSPNTISIDNLENLSSILDVSFFELYEIVKKFKEKVD